MAHGPRWRPGPRGSACEAARTRAPRVGWGGDVATSLRPRWSPRPRPHSAFLPPQNPEVGQAEARRRRGGGGGGRRPAVAELPRERVCVRAGGGAAWPGQPGPDGRGGHGLGRVAGQVPEAGPGVLEGTRRGRGARGLWLCGLGGLGRDSSGRRGPAAGPTSSALSPAPLGPPLPCLHLPLPRDGAGRCLQKGAGV